MNQWQPMIDRCREIADRVDELLMCRATYSVLRDRSLVITTTDDLETLLYAARYVANSLGAMKMGASQGTLPNPAMKKTS